MDQINRPTGPFRIIDMLRADVSVNDIDQVMEAYQVLKDINNDNFRIIQIKNKLYSLQHISIKGIFND